jgi:RNA polymerase sigma factor (sigma-70 family)
VYTYSSDAALWDDFLTGSRAAYAYIYERYARILYNYGYKIAQNRQLTEDCLQDLFLTILESRDRLGRTDSIKFYLMRSLRRELVRRLQAEQRFDTDPDALDFQVEFHYEPSWLDSQISAEQSAMLLAELNALPPRQKEALFLKYFDNLSYEEIAGVMNIEQSSAYKVIYKGIAALQKRVGSAVLSLLLL